MLSSDTEGFPFLVPSSGPLHPAGKEETEGSAPLHAASGPHGLPALWLCLLTPGRFWGAHYVWQEHAAQLAGPLQL